MVETFIDPYKNTYYEGNYVINECYYNLPKSKTYYFNDGAKPTYIYSHLVCASKFTTPPASHNICGSYPTFKLPIKTLQSIEKALENLRLINGDI
jgi:hypothetical protein